MLGVCIKYYYENYGGMLQAFATIKMLEKRGVEYELIRYKKKLSKIGIIKSLPRLLNGVLINDKKDIIKKKIGMITNSEFAKNYQIRIKSFQEFKENNFKSLSPIFNGFQELCTGTDRYDAVMTGSDQLWSPAGLPTNFFNLMFVPDNIRKISYASSFGVREVPWYQKNRTKKYLQRIEFISMRENAGAEIVKKLTERTVPVILDPVFMLSEEEWEAYIPSQKIIDEPYIFAYFLGTNIDYRKKVEKMASELGLKIVALRHFDQYVKEDENFGDFAPYDVSPDKFLNILRGAEYIYTDSFHGACFSIINSKRFIVFNRYSDNSKNSKNSRIDTLCNNLHLTNRRFDCKKNLVQQMQEPINYEIVHTKLNELKKDANLYLDDALRGIQ